jgi:asparagine synthase (glutamine-hydrolysing)
MAHSLEVRAPYLDPSVVDHFTNLPPRLIFRNGRGKYLLRTSAEGILPRRVLDRPKKGFGLPQATWLRTHLRERMEQAIVDSRSRGWFRTSVIDGMWRAHQSGRADYRRSLWNFLFSFPFQS